jgi:hypothetical protein
LSPFYRKRVARPDTKIIGSPSEVYLGAGITYNPRSYATLQRPASHGWTLEIKRAPVILSNIPPYPIIKPLQFFRRRLDSCHRLSMLSSLSIPVVNHVLLAVPSKVQVILAAGGEQSPCGRAFQSPGPPPYISRSHGLGLAYVRSKLSVRVIRILRD